MASDDDYLSDLTDIESDDYTESKGKKPVTKSAWRVRKALTPARATTYSAQALYDQIHAGDINLEPEYQRDVVWPETKQIMIIDSIFRNFYIPPVIFAVKVHDDGSETKTCIDGKQRLTSIHRFMDGVIPHKDPITGEKLWFREGSSVSRGVKRQLMPDKYRKVFCNKQIVCVEYHEISEEDEREVFQRVQLGMALTPAERLQVISTPRAIFVREVINTFLREDGVLGPDTLNWNTNRGTDFRCLGHSIHIMATSAPKKSIMSDFSHVEKWLQAKDQVDKNFKEGVIEAFRIFSRLVLDSKYGKIFKKYKKVSPIEFVYTAVFIYMYKESTSVAQLAVGIEEMFDHVRTIYMDVRMNNRVQKTFIAFVSGWKGQKGNGGSGAAGQKRKRVATSTKKKKVDEDMDVDEESDEDEDEDYEAPGTKKKILPGKSATSKGVSITSTPVIEQPKTPQLKTESGSGDNPTVASAPPKQTVSSPKPTLDRLAALRKTKETIAQNQAARAAQASAPPSALPTPSRTEGTTGSKQASFVSANPQMLPSPAQGFIVPPLLAGAGAVAIPASGATTFTLSPVEQSSLQNQGQGLNLNSNGTPSGRNPYRIEGLPPPSLSAPPHSAGSATSFAERGERDRDRDRERERRGVYDDRERDSHRRYDQHRRENGGFGGGGSTSQRSPDGRDRGRSASGRWR